MIVKRVGVLSCARIVAAIYAVIGLALGVCFSIATLLGFDVGAGASAAEAGWLRPLFGLGAVVALPVVYGVMGYVGGSIGAWAFNHAAKAMGGLELEVHLRTGGEPS